MIQCNKSNVQYIGETKRHLSDTESEKGSTQRHIDQTTAVSDHLNTLPAYSMSNKELVPLEIINPFRDSIDLPEIIQKVNLNLFSS